jgi:D-proline reductase (dithiol) PrdB
VGLIQRVIEAAGIPTVSVSIVRKLTEEALVPRAVFVKWPIGHPLGEPDRVDQQTTVIRCAFRALTEIKEPGTIIDLPFRWRRYEDLTKKVEIG